LRPGGRTAFYTIFIPEGLSEDARRRALAAGPPAVQTPQEHAAMLYSAGFVEISETDVTGEFVSVSRSLLEARQRYADPLRRAEGQSEFAERQTKSRGNIAAAEAGLLRRSLFVAERPH
jgi:hypothetical protein